MNVQDVFLNQARKTKTPLTIHVTNGYQIKKACVCSYDNFVVLVECEGKQMMIFKHAISTITPDEPLELKEEGEKRHE